MLDTSALIARQLLREAHKAEKTALRNATRRGRQWWPKRLAALS